MDLQELMARVIDSLYDGLTGGSAELPLPRNVTLNWLMPGLPFHESAFDFAIAGPFAGPTPLTLDYFKELVAAIEGENADKDRQWVIEEAKRMYQQNLLGTYEAWSRLVDFIPLAKPSAETSQWKPAADAGKYKHTSVVYAQAGQTLSKVYEDTLIRCEVADDELTEEQQKMIERSRALLQEAVEVEDFLTGEKRIEHRDSRVMIAYKEKKTAYENAAIDYATRLAQAQNGTAEDLVAWQQSGGIFRNRATQALSDWQATGYKDDVERAQATLSHILGSSMVQWKQNLSNIVQQINNTTQGVYGYPFFPASIIPGGFARSQGWTEFRELNMERHSSYSESSRRGSARVGFSLGIFSIGGGGGGGVKDTNFQFSSNNFGIEFKYTTVEIIRPVYNPNFFFSRGWRPKDTFIRDYGPVHSDGKEPPAGAMIGYPTKALFIKDLVIHSQDVASYVRSHEQHISGGGFVGIGPFVIGGKYQQANKSRESNYTLDSASIRVHGLQLVGFLSALFPQTANPSPDVKKWI